MVVNHLLDLAVDKEGARMHSIFRLLILILILGTLQGCPYLTVLHLQNGSEIPVSVHGIGIGVGEEKDVGYVVEKNGSLFISMDVVFEKNICEYDLEGLNSLPKDYYSKDSRGVYYRVLVDKDMLLYVISGSEISQQPEGFPLRPDSCNISQD